MKIISFAWTTAQLLNKTKTVTRRNWNERYAKTFKIGELVQAYDRNPRFKGKPVAIIKILDIRQVPLKDINGSEELVREGLAWLSPAAFINNWISEYPGTDENSKVWRIEFKLLKLLKEGK